MNHGATHEVTAAMPDGVISPARLRAISGKKHATAVRRWARTNGIKVGDGADGPWTTLAALNEALKVTTAKEAPYNPRDLL